jgi:hypothetical protein
MNDLISLAELELTNAIVHPDRYNVSMRRMYLADLKKHTDYSILLTDYKRLRSEHFRVFPNDNQTLFQYDTFITRLSVAIQ